MKLVMGLMSIVFFQQVIVAHATELPPSQKAIAFVNVNVLTMSSSTPEILYNQTVTIGHSGSILEIGPSAKIKVPKNFLKVTGNGKLFLLPALSDMHIHLEFPEQLEMLLAKGVTTARVMWGKDKDGADSLNHFEIKKSIQEGRRIGPRLFIASTPLDGPNPIWPGVIEIKNPAEGRTTVQNMVAKGYDFIKVYNNLSAESYASIVKTAKELKVPVVGHVPNAVGYYNAVDAGQISFEHLEGTLAVMKNEIPDDNRNRNWQEEIDPSKLQKFVEKSKASEVWTCPTLSFYKPYETDELTLQKEESYKYVNQQLRDLWIAMLKKKRGDKSLLNSTGLQKRQAVVKALYEAKANLLVGTDSPNPYVVPGFSTHEELRRLANSGISNYDVLRIGTYNAARFLNKQDQFSSIEKGKLGEVILVEGNPLENLSSVENLKGVLSQGRWFSEKRLKGLLGKYRNGL